MAKKRAALTCGRGRGHAKSKKSKKSRSKLTHSLSDCSESDGETSVIRRLSSSPAI